MAKLRTFKQVDNDNRDIADTEELIPNLYSPPREIQGALARFFKTSLKIHATTGNVVTDDDGNARTTAYTIGLADADEIAPPAAHTNTANGSIIHLRFHAANAAGATLNVAQTSAIKIWAGGAQVPDNYFRPGDTASVVLDYQDALNPSLEGAIWRVMENKTGFAVDTTKRLDDVEAESEKTAAESKAATATVDTFTERLAIAEQQIRERFAFGDEFARPRFNLQVRDGVYRQGADMTPLQLPAITGDDLDYDDGTTDVEVEGVYLCAEKSKVKVSHFVDADQPATLIYDEDDYLPPGMAFNPVSRILSTDVGGVLPTAGVYSLRFMYLRTVIWRVTVEDAVLDEDGEPTEDDDGNAITTERVVEVRRSVLGDYISFNISVLVSGDFYDCQVVHANTGGLIGVETIFENVASLNLRAGATSALIELSGGGGGGGAGHGAKGGNGGTSQITAVASSATPVARAVGGVGGEIGTLTGNQAGASAYSVAGAPGGIGGLHQGGSGTRQVDYTAQNGTPGRLIHAHYHATDFPLTISIGGGGSGGSGGGSDGGNGGSGYAIIRWLA